MATPIGDGTVQVWWAGPDDAGGALLDLLDEPERGRYGRYLRQADRDRFLVAAALARLVPARWRWTAGARTAGGHTASPG